MPRAEKMSEEAREQYQRAVDALGDPAMWRVYRREMDRQAVIRALKRKRVGRAAGRRALQETEVGDGRE